MELSLQNITKFYFKNLALDRFSVHLTPGIYALLGPNGSGKSTLMNILTDNLKADSGTVMYTNDAGISENILKMGERFREKIGFMPQYSGFYPNFSAERFLWYIASLKGLDKNTATLQIPEVLAAVELSDVANHRIGTFSGGMKQRLAFAQAILGDPEILILDEPTAGLDPRQSVSIRNYISEIALDKIVLIATHVVSDIEYIAKEVIVMKKGTIAAKGSPSLLAKNMEGMVWQVTVPSEEVSEMQMFYRVTNISVPPTDANHVILRILSGHKPTSDAKTIVPTLEDYYLYTFGTEIL
ncbi:MAG: ATP-binding cassette domain-containing protein [Clostridia bacterium]|nr:ATP-binding cassette domain-containing protein [Clostridia bacterium]